MSHQRLRQLAEGGFSLLLILLGVVVYVNAPTLVSGWAFNIPGTTDVALAPDFFPRLAAVLMILASLGVMLTIHTRTGPLPLLETSRESYLKALLGLAGILAFILLVPITGFVVTSAAFIILSSVVAGYRRWLVLLPAAVLTPLLLWFVFRYGLHVALPHGHLF